MKGLDQMENYDYRISDYFALAMLQVGIEKKKVIQIVSMAHVLMDEISPEKAHRKTLEKMKEDCFNPL